MKLVMRIVGLLSLLTTVIVVTLCWDAHRLLATPLVINEVERISIEKGSRFAAVIDQIKAIDGLAAPRQGLYWRVYTRFTHLDSKIKAGDYDLAQGTTPLMALDLFVEGKAVFSQMRIPEGWVFEQALDLIKVHPDLTHTLPDNATGETVMRLLEAKDLPAEGQFFPDTYRFTKGMRDIDLLRHARSLMNKKLQSEWKNRAPNLPYASAQEALIMASIVEKETGAAVERPQIAGVFVRRLNLGMRLQTDPTVIYGMGKNFDGNIRRSDLVTDTPWNTYTRDGLPPTPICLPSAAAITAALHPNDNGNLYFVAKADGSGTHQFSATLDAHNAAVSRYQLRRTQ